MWMTFILRFTEEVERTHYSCVKAATQWKCRLGLLVEWDGVIRVYPSKWILAVENDGSVLGFVGFDPRDLARLPPRVSPFETGTSTVGLPRNHVNVCHCLTVYVLCF